MLHCCSVQSISLSWQSCGHLQSSVSFCIIVVCLVVSDAQLLHLYSHGQHLGSHACCLPAHTKHHHHCTGNFGLLARGGRGEGRGVADLISTGLWCFLCAAAVLKTLPVAIDHCNCLYPQPMHSVEQAKAAEEYIPHRFHHVAVVCVCVTRHNIYII